MEFIIHDYPEHKIAELKSYVQQIESVDDVLELPGNAAYHGARKIIVHSLQINPDFFDLKTGLAGDILQKFSNYRNSHLIYSLTVF